MRLKSYHTATVESAIRLAHIELGDQAVFLGARRNDVTSDPGQAYEVSFAVMEAEQEQSEAALTAARGRPVAGARAAAGRRAAHNGAASPPRNGEAETRTAGEATPQRAAEAADSGALVSWKKFLRQVGARDGRSRPAGLAGAAAAGNGPRGSADPELTNGTAAATRNGSAAATRSSSGAARGFVLPHWKEFIPAEERGLEHAPVPLSDAVRVLQADTAQAETGPAHTAQANGRATRTAAGSAQPNSVARQPDSVIGQPGAPPAAQARAGAQPAKAARAMAPPVEGQSAPLYSIERLGAELEQLRRMVERQHNGGAAVVLPAAGPLPARELLSDPRLARLYRGLSNNGVEPALAAELVAGLQPAAAQGADAARLTALLGREIRGRLPANSELGQGGGPRAVAALVGPSGAGKTTAVAKLAFRCGLLRRRRVRLLSVDQLRIGAVEPLQAYAELMNTPLQVVDEFDKLAAALGPAADDGARELVLIDTPGYGRREWERARRMAAALGGLGEVDVHLVLDLRTKPEDLRRAVENFLVFRPAKLLFTRIDETATFGGMLNEAVRTGLPLSFVSVGQRVPEDIVPAGEPELLRLLLKDRSPH